MKRILPLLSRPISDHQMSTTTVTKSLISLGNDVSQKRCISIVGGGRMEVLTNNNEQQQQHDKSLYGTQKNKLMSSPSRLGIIHQISQQQFSSSPFANGGGGGVSTTTTKKTKKDKFVPRKAAVKLTDKSRTFFKQLLENNPESVGIILNYHQSSTGEPRMVFSFDFIKEEQLTPDEEGVSLELLEDGSPKPPTESQHDGLPKLYIHHNAFMKVLGATVDIDLETITPILYDREGNKMDPNF